MTVRNYLIVSCVFFLAIALIHLLRVVAGWTLEIGPVDAPMVFSWMAFLFTGILGLWALRLLRASQSSRD